MNGSLKEQHEVVAATLTDLPLIYTLFEAAIAFQQQRGYVGWKSYDQDFIRKDVQEGLLFKVLMGESVHGIFSVCYTDQFIWRHLEKGDALYLHRLVVHPDFRGQRLFDKVLAWAQQQAIQKRLNFIRMDTWAENSKIIAFYKSFGFRMVEVYTTPDKADLPIQHRNLKVTLLEYRLQ